MSASTPQAPTPADAANLAPDAAFARWRENRLREFDEDYAAWRETGHTRFPPDFDAWRRARRELMAEQASAGVPLVPVDDGAAEDEKPPLPA